MTPVSDGDQPEAKRDRRQPDRGECVPGFFFAEGRDR